MPISTREELLEIAQAADAAGDADGAAEAMRLLHDLDVEDSKAEGVMGRGGQMVGDFLRRASDSATLGFNEYARAGLKGTDLEDERYETQMAGDRLGLIGDIAAQTVGGIAGAPWKTIGAGANLGKRALAYGLEGMGLGAGNAIGHGERGTDVLEEAGTGGLFSAGGGALTRGATKSRPLYPDDASLKAAGEGLGNFDPARKELAERLANVKDVRAAQGSDRDTFNAILEGMGQPATKPNIAQTSVQEAGKLAEKANWLGLLAPVADIAGIGGGAGFATTGALQGLKYAGRSNLANKVTKGQREKAITGLRSDPAADILPDPASLSLPRDLLAKLAASVGRTDDRR